MRWRGNHKPLGCNLVELRLTLIIDGAHKLAVLVIESEELVAAGGSGSKGERGGICGERGERIEDKCAFCVLLTETVKNIVLKHDISYD